MADHILEMRGITKTFPGVKALQDVTLEVERGEIHAICGENGAGKSTLMKVLSGVYPHGDYEGDIVYEGEHARFHSINDSEAKGIVIIHQELALIPYLSVAENIFLGNERRGRGGLVDWNRTNARGREAARARRPAREPDHAGHPARRRQAAAHRDRQGAEQGGQAAHPRRADRGAQRPGLRAPARAAAPAQGARHHLDHDLAQAQRDRRHRGPDHDHPRRHDHRDPRHERARRPRSSGSSRAWSAATSSTASPSGPPRSATRCSGSRTGPSTTRPRRAASWSTTRASTSGPARSSASRA